MELSAGSHGLPGRGRGSGISAARHWVSHPTGGWNCAAAVVFSRGPLVVVPALGARRDRSGERPYRGKKGTVLVGLGGYQMFDSLAIDRDGPLQLTRELLTLRSEQRAAPYGAAPRPETSADQLCQRIPSLCRRHAPRRRGLPAARRRARRAAPRDR